MLRNQSRVIRRILQSKALCSSATILPEKRLTPNPLIQKLSAEFEDISPVIRDLKNSELNNIHFDEWKSRIYMLKKFNFNDKECFTMISRHPYLLRIPLEKFTKSIEQWFAADLKINTVHSVLLHCPHLCEIDVIDIRKRLPVLHSLFRTQDALTNLLINSPNVMYDDWEMILKKINYLTKLRRFKMGEIVSSSALSKSFSFIQFRLNLLEKCGIYKQDNTPIHKLNKYDKSKFVNPHLKSILELNLKHFISVAKISSEEYAISKDLFMNQEIDE